MCIGIIGLNTKFLDILDIINLETKVVGVTKITGGVVYILFTNLIRLKGIFNWIFDFLVKHTYKKLRGSFWE
ncbi:hypothetical protein D3C73_802760 [compost metagenome]